MHCTNCSQTIDVDSRFCRHCGAENKQSVSAPSVIGQVHAVKPPAESESNRNIAPWLWGGGAILILLILAFSQAPTTPIEPTTESLVQDPSVINVATGVDKKVEEAATEPAATGINWNYSNDVDKVRGSTSYYATTISTNTIYQDPPYEPDTSMKLTVRRAPAFGTDVVLTISSGQLMCPSYEGCHGTVSFDGGPAQSVDFAGPADNSSDTIFVEGAVGFIAKLKKAKKVVIEKTVYEAGNPQFEFDVSGLKWEH